MIDVGKRNVLGVGIDAVDPEATLERIVAAAQTGRCLAVSAAASHAVMTAVDDPEHRWRLNNIDLVVADGQPVRHALRLLHGVRLPDAVRGTDLTAEVCRRAAELNLPVYLYGSTAETVRRFGDAFLERFPGFILAGVEASQFRQLTAQEFDELADRIRASGARIVLVGLGCPRQEVWVYEMRTRLSMPLLAVGAAFDFHAGTLSRAPRWMQKWSLEWAYRLGCEPGRLWKRYLGLGSRFIVLVARQRLRSNRFTDPGKRPSSELRYG